MSTTASYRVTLRAEDTVRYAWIAHRLNDKGPPEVRGVFLSVEAAKADPIIGAPGSGWVISKANLIGWNCIALLGGG